MSKSVVLKPVVLKAHAVAKSGYAAAEHCAAVAYAACEFLHAHELVIAAAVALLGLGILLIGAKLIEEAL